MTVERIDHRDIELGQPLRWDLYGRTGELLLRKGHIVRAARQLQERELFVRVEIAAMAVATPVAVVPSVTRLLASIVPDLTALLQTISKTGGDQHQPLQTLAQRVRDAWLLQPDVALALVALDQEGETSVRHVLHSAVVALHLARGARLRQEAQQAVVQAALTMNVGMLHYEPTLPAGHVPDGKLAALMREHPAMSVQLLRRAGIHEPTLLTAVLQHHEERDGGGYPNGIRAPALAPAAALLGLADRYCTLVGRDRVTPHAAIKRLAAPGTRLCALQALLSTELGTWPPGTLVRLVNGEIGIVSRRPRDPGGDPEVASLLGPRGVPLPKPIRRDTGTPLQTIRDVLDPDTCPIPINPATIWGTVAAP